MPKSDLSGAPFGLWLVGARGAISTCVAYGLAGLVEGILEPVGLVSESDALASLPLTSFEDIVLGGHDVCRRSMTDSVSELVRGGVVSAAVAEGGAARAARFDACIVPGLLAGPDVGLAARDPAAAADLGRAFG